MKTIYYPRNETELAFLKALLQGEKIIYYVHNDYFGSMKPGPCIPLFNAKSIMVADEDAERASRLIDEFRELEVEAPRSWRQRLRNLAEAVLFGWFIPGGSRSADSSENGVDRAARDR